ncbi:MAG: hypothetical protein GY839_04680 [candidate division Zixibacteria bacterium]|nr:hypothetical protein [candidate division Zixibacteria bacterium]
MQVAFVQMEPRFGYPEANLEKVLAMMESKPAELYVLPELFASGYVFISPDEVAKAADKVGDGLVYRTIADFAKARKCAVIYGFPEKASEGYFNSSLFVDEFGNHKLYRKIHLFFEEKQYFLPGNSPLGTIAYRDTKLGMMICFDWIFPETARCLALAGADIICHPVNLVMSYCQDSMKTRSIENRIFTITANRIGEEKRGDKGFKFTGKSQITDCEGNVIYRADVDKEEIFTADINIEDARNKRVNDLNDLFGDRRVEYYNRLGETIDGIHQ